MTTLPILGQLEIVVRGLWGLCCLACAYSPVTELTFDLCKYQHCIGAQMLFNSLLRNQLEKEISHLGLRNSDLFFFTFFLLKRETFYCNRTSRQDSPIKRILSLQNVKAITKYNNMWTSATQNLLKQQTNGATGSWRHPFCGDLGVFLWLHNWWKRKLILICSQTAVQQRVLFQVKQLWYSTADGMHVWCKATLNTFHCSLQFIL